MQLLQITVTPVKYELEIEHARLEYKQDFQPRANVQTTPPELKIDSKNTSVRLDTYEARKSLGFANAADRVAAGAERGQKEFSKYVRETVDMGKQMGRIEDGVTISQLINQKMLEQPQMYTAFLPSGGASISWEPNEINMDIKPGTMNYDWEIKGNSMSYVPGSVRMRIIQRGEVDIVYTGSPIYFPRSADPNYEEPTVG